MNRVTIKQYVKDGVYDWAVFREKDVKKLHSPIKHGEATPIMFGICKNEALWWKKSLNQKKKEI